MILVGNYQNRKVGDECGKIIILSYADNEEDTYKDILEVISRKGLESCNTFRGVEIIMAGTLKIDLIQRSVLVNNIEIELTHTEFEILCLLEGNPGRVFSKEQIYDIVWKESYDGDYNIVMSHIHNIREKIEDNPSEPVYIQTVWGVGYRFNKNLSSDL